MEKQGAEVRNGARAGVLSPRSSVFAGWPLKVQVAVAVIACSRILFSRLKAGLPKTPRL